MKDDPTLKTLQLFYAALMVDAASNFEHFGIVDKVEAKKVREQRAVAPAQLRQLGIRTPRELFECFSATFGCAAWSVQETAEGVTVGETKSCVACAIARKRGSGRPCAIYCINPFRGLSDSLSPAHKLTVEGTLWEGDRCRSRLGRADEAATGTTD
jgi:hypothetical protein